VAVILPIQESSESRCIFASIQCQIPKASTVHRHGHKIFSKCTDKTMTIMFISAATGPAGSSRK
jgi:hypothetical protein